MGLGFSSYFCFDWGLIASDRKYTASDGKAFPLRRRTLIICLQLVLVGVWTPQCYIYIPRAVVPADLPTLTHMSNLILVSRLN